MSNIDIGQMSFYTSQVLWVDVGLASSAIIINLMLSYTAFVEEHWLGLLFRVILYFIDFSIFAAVVVAMQGKGGIAIFYFFRAAFLLSAQNTTLFSCVLPALFGFAVLRVASIVLEKYYFLQVRSNVSKQQREQESKRRRQGRKWFLVLLGVVLFAVTETITYSMDGGIFGLLLVAAICCLAIEFHQMLACQDYTARLISNSIHLNFYFLLLITLLLPKLHNKDLMAYLPAAFIQLVVLMVYSRIFIGQKSHKFHSLDGDLLYAVYPLGDSSGTILYKGEEAQVRLARAADRASRQLALLIYVLGVLLSSFYGNPIWISVGVLIINIYPDQSSQSRVTSWIQEKLKVKLRLHLLLPLLVFLGKVWSEDLSRRQLLQAKISFCGTALQGQTTASAVLCLVAMASQVISHRRHKIWIQKGVAMGCPLLLFWFCGWLQCQQLNHLLMVGYSLGICASTIREQRMGVVKGGKVD